MDTKNNVITVNGALYIAPIFNTGSNPTFGNVNNHSPTSVPVVKVKDAQVDLGLIALMYFQCDSESVRKRQECQMQERERCMREQLDQERRFTEAAIKRERTALWAEREAFEEEKRSLQTQFNLPETPYPEYSRINNSNPRQAATRKAQSKDEDNDVIKESETIHTSTAVSMSASQYSRTAISTRQTPNTTSATNPESQFPKTTLRSGSICGNIAATSRDGRREVTIADNNVFRASFEVMSVHTASVSKSRERRSSTEEVSPPRANKHPRLGSTAVQKCAEFENSDTERKNYLRGQDMSQPQPTRASVCVSRRSSVVSQDVKENLRPSAPPSQDLSGKRVSAGPAGQRDFKAKLLQSVNAKFRATGALSPTSSCSVASAGPSSAARQRDFKTKMQLPQSANAKFRATGVPSPTPIPTSSRSLVSVTRKALPSVATKAASAANTNTLQRQLPTPSTMTNLTRSTNSMVSCNSFQTSKLSKGNSSGSTVLANQKTSDKMTTAFRKKVAVASTAQEKPDKSRRSRGRVSSGLSKRPVLATITKGRRE